MHKQEIYIYSTLKTRQTILIKTKEIRQIGKAILQKTECLGKIRQ